VKAIKRAKGARGARKTPVPGARANGRTGTATTPTRLMRIRALDPRQTCGLGTTVMQLFRVDDLPTAAASTHLVFFDRHGWYCEHGRECPAVDAVRKYERATIRTR
jgi:hypothetical protein